MGFLQKVTGMKYQNMGVNYWKKEGADRVIQETGTNPIW